jgi:hypothetical protein
MNGIEASDTINHFLEKNEINWTLRWRSAANVWRKCRTSDICKKRPLVLSGHMTFFIQALVQEISEELQNIFQAVTVLLTMSKIIYILQSYVTIWR